MSRKSKKALVRYFNELADEYEKSDDFILRDLPECTYCNDSGKDDPFDVDWATLDCLKCDGTGKTGWRYDTDGNKVPIVYKKER